MVAVMVVVVMMDGRQFVFGAGRIMVMEMKHPEQKKHRRQAGEHAETERAGAVDPKLLDGVGHHLEQRDAEHQAADEADHQLQPQMRQPDERREGATCEGGGDDEQAVDDENGNHLRQENVRERKFVSIATAEPN